MSASATMSVQACGRLVASAAQSCATPAEAARSSPQPSWDAMANSFASLSAAFAWGSILLALVGIAGAVGWGFLVKNWAEKAARTEATECAQKHVDMWLEKEAPRIIREHVEFLQNASLGETSDASAADEMGKGAG